jgi:hypothetical protein
MTIKPPQEERHCQLDAQFKAAPSSVDNVENNRESHIPSLSIPLPAVVVTTVTNPPQPKPVAASRWLRARSQTPNKKPESMLLQRLDLHTIRVVEPLHGPCLVGRARSSEETEL